MEHEFILKFKNKDHSDFECINCKLIKKIYGVLSYYQVEENYIIHSEEDYDCNIRIIKNVIT